MANHLPSSTASIGHYVWAGLDFMLDANGRPVLLEANRSSHMLGEYMELHGDDKPFALVAQLMNACDGPPCLLWRRDDPLPGADEDACFIGRHLSRHLRQEPLICNVEDNQSPRDVLTARNGREVRPGSLFRWWYGLPWSYERAGVRVINPNCAWVAVRDKLACSAALTPARTFRVPYSVAVNSTEDAQRVLTHEAHRFVRGYVLKPRVGWGGHGVRVFDDATPPTQVLPQSILSERIYPPRTDGQFWDARVFVMAGVYLGGVRYASPGPVTNFFQGGQPSRLDAGIERLLEPAAIEAVQRLDAVAESIHQGPIPLDSPLTRVDY